MYKGNSSVIQNTRTNTLIAGATTIPLTKSALKCRFSINYKKQHYYLLIYRKTIMFARKIPPLPAK